MNRDDMIRLAKQAGFDVIEGDAPWLKDPVGIGPRIWWNDSSMGEELERFAQLVAAQAAAEEREACAKVCESRVMGDHSREDQEAQRCADAIRARGTA